MLPQGDAVTVKVETKKKKKELQDAPVSVATKKTIEQYKKGRNKYTRRMRLK